MCGIAGAVGWVDDRIRIAVAQMRDVLGHRGPDDSGTFRVGPAALGHARLSILDLSESGHQPFLSQDEDLVLVYNHANRY